MIAPATSWDESRWLIRLSTADYLPRERGRFMAAGPPTAADGEVSNGVEPAAASTLCGVAGNARRCSLPAPRARVPVFRQIFLQPRGHRQRTAF
jgi:hypothetical protein